MPHFVDVADISDSGDGPLAVVDLTQNYGSTGALVPVLSVSLAKTYTLDQFVLFIFNSSDWNVGRKDPMYAIGATALDVSGNWASTPITVVPGTYHIVIMNSDNVIVVIAPFLQVTL